jgi:hypothetical protein
MMIAQSSADARSTGCGMLATSFNVASGSAARVDISAETMTNIESTNAASFDPTTIVLSSGAVCRKH